MKRLTVLLMMVVLVCTATGKRLNVATTGDYKTAYLWYTDHEGKHIAEPDQIVVMDKDLHSQEQDVWHTWDNADCDVVVGSVDTYCHGICQRGWTYTTDPNGLPALATDSRGFLRVTGWYDELHTGQDHTIYHSCGAEAMHLSIHCYSAPEDSGDITKSVQVWYYRNDHYNEQYEPHWWEYIRACRYQQAQEDTLPTGWVFSETGELVLDLCGFFSAWLSEAEQDLVWDFNNDNTINLEDWAELACGS
jgi:hypothetical protein